MGQPTLQLSNVQTTIPAIGFGTWEIKPDETKQSVLTALEAGYRLIDTAKIYGNEKEVGEAIRDSGLQRSELFITTKLWNEDQGYDSTMRAFEASLDKLGLDYLDLYLIHWPATSRRGESWQALQDLYDQGQVRAIGVSNFTVRHLEELKSDSRMVPMVNQIEFHPYIYEDQREVLEYCRQHDIIVEAYSPLARGARQPSTIIKVIANELNKTPAQILLRWCIQQGTVPLPRSRSAEHTRENFEVFNFELNDVQMKNLNSLSDGQRVTWDPEEMP
jgi:diketogulonate reductase-like aldo/keto reductase